MRKLVSLGGISFAALLLPLCSAAATPFPGGGESGSPEHSAKVASLVKAVVGDLTADKSYECQCSTGECSPEECPSMNSPKAKFTKFLSYADEASLKLVEPLAVDFVKSSSIDEDDAHAFIGMFLESRSAAALPVAEAMHGAAPRQFTDRHLLGFCEMGSKSLTKPLASLVKKGDADVECAAYFAMRGEKLGAKTLKAALKSEVTPETALDVLVAGMALEHLGKKGARAYSQKAVHTAALAALDGERLDDARAMAIAASVAHSASLSSKPVLSLMDLQCAEYVAKVEKMGKLASADAIFEKIEKALPIL